MFLCNSIKYRGSLYWFRCDLDLVDCPEPESLEEKTVTYDTVGKQLVKKPDASSWVWGDYIDNVQDDGSFSIDGTSSSTFKHFNTWEECRKYIADKKPHANIVVFRKDTHPVDDYRKTCGYVKLGEYKDNDTMHTYACTKPGVKVESGITPV